MAALLKDHDTEPRLEAKVVRGKMRYSTVQKVAGLLFGVGETFGEPRRP